MKRGTKIIFYVTFHYISTIFQVFKYNESDFPNEGRATKHAYGIYGRPGETTLNQNESGSTCTSASHFPEYGMKTDHFPRYGQTVQFVTPDTPAPNGNPGLTLCGTVTEADIDKYEHFSAQSLVNVSPVRRPYIKNLFKLLPCQGSPQKEGDDLKFGQEFLICTTGSWNGQPLYVKSDPPRAMCPGNALNHGIVTFSPKEDRYCRWKAIYMHRAEREAMDMHPIEPETRMMIRQVMTNKSLSAEPSLWCQTFFGPEADVSVHDYSTPKRTDSVNSIWYFVTRDKRDGSGSTTNDEDK